MDSQERGRDTLLRLGFLLLVLSAVAIAAAVVRTSFFRERSRGDALSFVPEWHEIAAVGARIGSSTAAVSVIVFADFECPACAAFHEITRALVRDYSHDVAVLHVNYPLAYHPYAWAAARASQCTARLGRFAEWADAVYAREEPLGDTAWARLASRAKVGVPELIARCANDTTLDARLHKETAWGARIGVTETPTVLINGWRFNRAPDRNQVEIAVRALLVGEDPNGALAAAHRRFQQGVPTRTLDAANGRVNDEFTNLTGIRELADGRVLLVDGRENRIVVADLVSGASRPAMQRGSGPGEYSSLTGLYPLAHDSTLVPDAVARRWTILAGDRIGATLGASRPAIVAAAALADGIFFGVDTTEAALVAVTVPPPSRTGTFNIGERDSVAFATIARQTGRVDTAGWLRADPMKQVVQLGEAGVVLRVENSYPPWGIGDRAVLCGDGWVAAARTQPYRVDWRSPSASWRRGPPIAYTVIPVTAAEKRLYMAALVAGTDRAPEPPERFPDWPAQIPALRGPWTLVCGPSGTVLVWRNTSGLDPRSQYDIIDRSGRLAARLLLDRDQRVLGFGKKAVYVITRDADRVQRVQRHPYPW